MFFEDDGMIATPLYEGAHRPLWLSRDSDRYWTVNADMRTRDGEPRFTMLENMWSLSVAPEAFECPPNGRKLAATYADGDSVQIEFKAFNTIEEVRARYEWSSTMQEESDFELPIVAAEVTMALYDGTVRFGPRLSSFPGVAISDSIQVGGQVSFFLSPRFEWQVPPYEGWHPLLNRDGTLRS